MNDAYEFFVELVSQAFHADVLITKRARRIEVLEAEITQVKADSGPHGNGRPQLRSCRP